MIHLQHLQAYRGPSLLRGPTFLYLAPDPWLRGHIANYTLTFPTPDTMPDAYTILPTASSTLTVSADTRALYTGLRGVNTRPCTVGGHANKMRMLLLIEFMPGSLSPFLRAGQQALADASFSLSDLDKALARAVEMCLMEAPDIPALVAALDTLFLGRLADESLDTPVRDMLRQVVSMHGNVRVADLSAAWHYSEKQIQRLFLRDVGVTPKAFCRIVRVNHVIRLLASAVSRARAAQDAGFFDQAHCIHDFKTLCGVTPETYLQNRSLFYNDTFKM